MIPILSGNVATALGGAYEVANSCRFNDGDSASMSRDQSANSAGTTTKGTLSVWIKISAAGTEQVIYERRTDASNYFKVWFENDKLLIQNVTSGSVAMKKETNRLFRDPSAWMNIVVRIDSTDGTAEDRQQIWINGVRETSFANSTTATEDASQQINTGTGTDYIGKRATGNYFDGYMAEFVWIDGTSYAATSFGEFDEDSPTIWKPIDVSGLTFGTNGFYLDFEDSANLGNDANGGTDFTEANLAATDQATDTPTNNFATLNPLFPSAGTTAFSEGNLKLVASGSAGSGISSIGVTAGKWYMEVKQTAVNEPLGNGESGIAVVGDPTGNLGNVEGTAFAYGIRNYNGTKFENTSSGSSWHANWTAGDIIGVALDMDNHRVYFSKDGQWSDGSGNFDESTPNAYLSLSTAKTDYFLAMSQLHSTATETYEVNFGSPSFTISSGNADGAGYGNFEYSVPSGYYSLCTKNLAEYG